MTEPTTHTLDVPGAVLTYHVRPNGSSAEPVLLMIGAPMGAPGFGTLAGYFAGRTACRCIAFRARPEWSPIRGPKMNHTGGTT